MKQVKCIICVLSYFQTVIMGTSLKYVFESTSKADVTLVPLTWNWTLPHALSCARTCRLTYRSCYSFIFNKQTRSCVSGSWLIPITTTRDIYNGDLYTTGAFCDNNFIVRTDNGFAACLQVFTNKLNYSAARSHCKDFGAELYTMKSLEKITILSDEINLSNESFWIGLDDLQTEGQFKWADDGTVLDDKWKSELFALDEPNNVYEEDCVVYSPYRLGLDDKPCSWAQNYVCELKPSHLFNKASETRF